MTKLWRLLAIAAAMNLTAGVATAAAQAVMVRHAPAGMAIEILVNDAIVSTGAVGADGDGRIEFTLPDPGEMDSNLYVDVCEKSRRVLIVDRNKRPAAPPAGCERREISGVFWVRRVNTLVVDVGGTQPSLLLIRGAYNPPTPQPTDEDGGASTPHRPAPTGFTLFGGGGLGKFRDAATLACGNAVGCNVKDSGIGYSFGATYWITRWLGAEGAYIKPRTVRVKGGDTFTFDSAFDVDVFTAAAKVAIPAGPVRVYGLIGGNFHQSTLNLTETIDTATQTFLQKTHGWGLIYGGGLEGWVTPKVALYGELSLATVKGKAEDKGEGQIDDRLRFLGVGLRIRLSR